MVDDPLESRSVPFQLRGASYSPCRTLQSQNHSCRHSSTSDICWCNWLVGCNCLCRRGQTSSRSCGGWCCPDSSPVTHCCCSECFSGNARVTQCSYCMHMHLCISKADPTAAGHPMTVRRHACAKPELMGLNSWQRPDVRVAVVGHES